MSHPLSQETIQRIANEIVDDLITGSHLFDTLCEFATELASDVIPYDTNRNGGSNDVNVEVAGQITELLAKYLKSGHHWMTQTD
jgi:hypothetical protein